MAISGLGSGVGVKLEHTAVNPETTSFSDIVEVLTISVAGQTCGVTDISSAGSPDEYREFLPNLLDAGSISMTIRYGSTLGVAAEDTYDELQTLFDTREIGIFKITIPGTASSSWACKAFIQRLGMQVHYTGGVQCQVVIKCTGKPTFTEAQA